MLVLIQQRVLLKDLMKIELLLLINYPHVKIIKAIGLKFHFLVSMMVMVVIGYLNILKNIYINIQQQVNTFLLILKKLLKKVVKKQKKILYNNLNNKTLKEEQVLVQSLHLFIRIKYVQVTLVIQELQYLKIKVLML